MIGDAAVLADQLLDPKRSWLLAAVHASSNRSGCSCLATSVQGDLRNALDNLKRAARSMVVATEQQDGKLLVMPT